VIEPLKPFIGTWHVKSSLGDVRAMATFEWALGGAFLLQRQEIDLPEAPDALCLIGAEGAHFAQHYFDSRGVVRKYTMTFNGELWTLERDDEDFAQRYTGEFSGNLIEGQWEIKQPGEKNWRKDFELSYERE
jgi:hypothetical protein